MILWLELFNIWIPNNRISIVGVVTKNPESLKGGKKRFLSTILRIRYQLHYSDSPLSRRRLADTKIIVYLWLLAHEIGSISKEMGTPI